MANVTFSTWDSIPISSHLFENIALAILLLLSYVFNLFHLYLPWASQMALVGNEPAGNAGDPWVRKIPWRKSRQPTPGFLPGESHGQRSLVGYSPQHHKESDTTEAT